MSSNIKILIVEDEPYIAEDIFGFLKEKGYQVCETCYTKEESLAALNQHEPDLALLDINLGRGSEGIEIARYIAANKEIPFIFLTSYTTKFVIEEAKQTHPMGYITKPINFDSLFSTIEIALFNYSKMKLQYQPKLYVLNQQLSLEITNKEFDILLAIYSGKNNQQIATSNFISINTVKTHIRNLYEKMKVRSRSALLAEVRRLMQLQ